MNLKQTEHLQNLFNLWLKWQLNRATKQQIGDNAVDVLNEATQLFQGVKNKQDLKDQVRKWRTTTKNIQSIFEDHLPKEPTHDKHYTEFKRDIEKEFLQFLLHGYADFQNKKGLFKESNMRRTGNYAVVIISYNPNTKKWKQDFFFKDNPIKDHPVRMGYANALTQTFGLQEARDILDATIQGWEEQYISALKEQQARQPVAIIIADTKHERIKDVHLFSNDKRILKKLKNEVLIDEYKNDFWEAWEQTTLRREIHK